MVQSEIIFNSNTFPKLKGYESFIIDFERMISESIKNCTDMAIALLDMDQLELINTNYGSEFGDKILVALSNHLIENLPVEAQLYHYNGDQLAILFPVAEKNAVHLFLDKLRSDFFNEINLAYPEKNISFSAGIACCPEGGTNAGILIRKARAALQKSKLSGRNKVSLAKLEKYVSRKTLFTTEQLQQLMSLSKKLNISDGILLREAVDDLLRKYDR